MVGKIAFKSFASQAGTGYWRGQHVTFPILRITFALGYTLTAASSPQRDANCLFRVLDCVVLVIPITSLLCSESIQYCIDVQFATIICVCDLRPKIARLTGEVPTMQPSQSFTINRLPISRDTVFAALSSLPGASGAAQAVMQVDVMTDDGRMAAIEFQRLQLLDDAGHSDWNWEAMTCWEIPEAA